jgi:hypothetical protein
MKKTLLCAMIALQTAGSAWAQSLNPAAPAPLQPGTNRGSVDNQSGGHYWYFTFEPGTASIKVHALNFSGATHGLTVHVYDAAKTWHIDKQMDEQKADWVSPGKIKKATKVIILISPPGSGQLLGDLTRSGADYELEVTGDVKFAQKSTGDPICRNYQDWNSDGHGMCKFLPDGTIKCSDGVTGTWKVFDADSHLYIVSLPGRNINVKQVLGVGLMDSGTNSQAFKELK